MPAEASIRALEHANDADLVMDLHWTLAQCRMLVGSSAESLATLDQALASPGISVRHCARLLILVARTYLSIGEVEKAGEVTGNARAAAEIPHRQADVLYCRGLLDHDARQLVLAAERYDRAHRPLQRAKALEAAVGCFLDDGERNAARGAFAGAVEVYDFLGAAADLTRLEATFRGAVSRCRGPSR